MADKKMVEQITSMEEDFAQWYTDVVLKAELIGYTSVKGCMAIKPAGYAIWELIQKQLDERFKADVYKRQVLFHPCQSADGCRENKRHFRADPEADSAAHAACGRPVESPCRKLE